MSNKLITTLSLEGKAEAITSKSSPDWYAFSSAWFCRTADTEAGTVKRIENNLVLARLPVESIMYWLVCQNVIPSGCQVGAGIISPLGIKRVSSCFCSLFCKCHCPQWVTSQPSGVTNSGIKVGFVRYIICNGNISVKILRYAGIPAAHTVIWAIMPRR